MTSTECTAGISPTNMTYHFQYRYTDLKKICVISEVRRRQEKKTNVNTKTNYRSHKTNTHVANCLLVHKTLGPDKDYLRRRKKMASVNYTLVLPGNMHIDCKHAIPGKHPAANPLPRPGQPLLHLVPRRASLAYFAYWLKLP